MFYFDCNSIFPIFTVNVLSSAVPFFISSVSPKMERHWFDTSKCLQVSQCTTASVKNSCVISFLAPEGGAEKSTKLRHVSHHWLWLKSLQKLGWGHLCFSLNSSQAGHRQHNTRESQTEITLVTLLHG